MIMIPRLHSGWIVESFSVNFIQGALNSILSFVTLIFVNCWIYRNFSWHELIWIQIVWMEWQRQRQETLNFKLSIAQVEYVWAISFLRFEFFFAFHFRFDKVVSHFQLILVSSSSPSSGYINHLGHVRKWFTFFC